MSKLKSLISLILILSFIGLISGVSEAKTQLDNLRLAQRSYRRVFPESVSPKPASIQERDSREEMKREYKEEKQKQQEELLELEAAPKEEVPPEEGEEEEGEEEKKEPKLVDKKPAQIYYKISINDRLYISVWRVPDLSLEFIVGPDGYISFPLIGDIYAYGKTLAELDTEVTKKLKEYVIDPQVSVMVREFAGDKVTVIGEVTSPGIYKFVRRANLMDIIALAHGFTDRAKIVSVVIIREPSNPREDPELIVVNAKNILKGKLRRIEVKPNDIVYVSRTFVSNFKEFFDDWIVPIIGTATDLVLDYETFMALRRARRH